MSPGRPLSRQTMALIGVPLRAIVAGFSPANGKAGGSFLTRSLTADVEDRRGTPPESRGTREAAFAPSTYSAKTHTVALDLSRGVRVKRFFGFEELEITPEAIDLTRVPAGLVPVLDSHNAFEIERKIGHLLSARIENGVLRAQMKFAETEVGKRTEAMVARGELPGVSIGYDVVDWRRVEVIEGGREVWRAMRWTLLEASFVLIPADPTAGVRSASTSPGSIREEDEMLTRNASGGGQSPGNNDAVVIAARRQGMEDERARQSDIRGRVRASNLPDSIAEDLISRGVSDNETIGATIIDAMAARGSQHPSRPSARVIEDNTDPAVLVERMATAIAARSTAHLPTTMRVAMPAEARQFGNLSLLDCWAELARARGEKIDRHMQRGPLFSALARSHSTSDFALLLAGSSNQVLLPAYNLAPPRFTIFAGRKSFADFKPHNFLRAGDFPAPLAKGETGEFSFGTLSESKNQAVCGTWGRVLRISRDIIINDNMSAFSQMPLAAARRAADFVNATGFALFALNAGGGPGITEAGATVNLWHATHANLAGAGGVIDLTNVGAGRTAMMKQTTLDGLKINVEPRFLLTSPDKLTIAEQFVATNLTPQVFSDVNPIGPKLVAIGDANLTGNAWYLFADPMLAETFVYGYLEGFEGPRFETRTDFMTEGVDMKLALDFGVSAIDFRGTYKNPGA